LAGNVEPFDINTVVEGDCLALIPKLPDESIDILVTSPPYWGQRLSNGTGTEENPLDYLKFLERVFVSFLPKLKKCGLVWINLGDAYNTPVNWKM
jgi:DNA modification methylase